MTLRYPFTIAPLTPGKVRKTEADDFLLSYLHSSKSKLYGKQPFLIYGVLFLPSQAVSDLPSLKELALERIVKRVPMFRSVVRLTKRMYGLMNDYEYVEQDISDIDLDYHCSIVDQTDNEGKKDTVWTQRDFAHYLNLAAKRRLDCNRPAWKLAKVERLLDPDGNESSALVLFVDHSIGDGQYLVSVIWDCIADQREQEVRAPVERSRRQAHGRQESFLTLLFTFILAFIEALFPMRSERNRLMRSKESSQTDDGDSILAFGPSIPTQCILEIKHKLGFPTFNDVVIAGLVKASKKYLEEDSSQVKLVQNTPAINVRIMASTRKPEQHPLEEKFFQYSVLSVVARVGWHTSDAASLLKHINTEILKSYYRWFFYFQNVSLVWMMRFAPSILWDGILKNVPKSTINVSSIRGPSKVLHVNGYEVQQARFNLSGYLSTYVGVCSYDNQVSVNAYMDSTHSYQDALRLCELWTEQIREMHKQVVEQEK